MRIGLFTDTYFPFTNGITYVVDITRRELETQGHKVWVFAPETSLKKSLLGKDRKIIRFTAVKGLLFDDQLTSIFFPPRQVGKIAKLNLDVIIVFTPGQIGCVGAYASDRLGVPMIIQYGTDFMAYIKEYPAALPASLALLLTAPVTVGLSVGETIKILRSAVSKDQPQLTWSQEVLQKGLSVLHSRASAVIGVSTKISDQLKTWPVKQKIVTIPTGVDALPIDPKFKQAFINQFGLAKTDQVILFVGRLSPEKNLKMLIKAFDNLSPSHPNAKLLLVGDYSYRSELEAYASKLSSSPKIVFAGRVERKKLGSVYALADIFAFPSLTDTQALVLNEAAHAGLPLVWCDSDKLNPVLDTGKTGYRSAPTASDFSQKIADLLVSPKKAKSMGQNAKVFALKFGQAEQAAKLDELLKSLVC